MSDPVRLPEPPLQQQRYSTDAPTVTDGAIPAGLLDAFWSYERSLAENDLDALDAFFAPGEFTARGDAAGLIIGHSAISAYRQARGGAPARLVRELRVSVLGQDAALLIAVLAPLTGGRGQQTQLWQRGEAGWRITAAHLSGPAPVVDGSIWRTAGTPLVRAAGEGPLDGHRVAVKDLFSVAGHAVGAGVPAYLAEAEIERTSAPAVRALLDAGADVVGIARTDEFAYSIAGRNPHYGTPPNPWVPGAISGGSSSGPASAVAMGQASIGLGTDTGGSVRVPASYLGLWGLRTTHDLVDRSGLLPLAPSFDTVGWLTRDAGALAAAAGATLPLDGAPLPAGFVTVPALAALVEPDVAAAFDSTVLELVRSGAVDQPGQFEIPDLDDIFESFRTVQGFEAWQSHGGWIRSHEGALGEEIGARFAWASTITSEEMEIGRAHLREVRERLADLLGTAVLLLPSASSPAPSVTAVGAENESVRAGTLRLTCIAGSAGAPAVSMPLMSVRGMPLGLGAIGPRGSDHALLDLGARFAAALGAS